MSEIHSPLQFGLSDERGTYLWGVGLAQKFNEIRHDEIMAPGRYRALFNAEQGADDPGPWTMRLIHPQ